jgi:hypothetical protein
MKPVRFAISLVAAAALVPLTALPALADPPGNDTPDGAVSLSLGDQYQEDTTQATTDQIDAKANRRCGAPYTNASVWFSYAPEQDGVFLVDMSQSDYSGGVMVFKGTPTPKHLLTCGPETVAARGHAGTTYLIMAFSDTKKNGGNLDLSLQGAPPPPSGQVALSPKGTIVPKGKAQIGGKFSCANADYVEIDGVLSQAWKRVRITGFFGQVEDGSLCDGKAHSWSQLVKSHNGFYAPGQAYLRVSVILCGELKCKVTKAHGHVMLSKNAPRQAMTSSFGATAQTSTMITADHSRFWPTR